jgi:hypothetical protein
LNGGINKACCATLVKLVTGLDDNITIQEQTSKIFEHKLETTKQVLGPKPSGLILELNTRLVWGTIATITSKM